MFIAAVALKLVKVWQELGRGRGVEGGSVQQTAQCAGEQSLQSQFVTLKSVKDKDSESHQHVD